MRIKSFDKNTYNLLIEYVFSKCDSFCLYNNSVHNFEMNPKFEKVFNIITSNPNYSKEKILKNYSKEFLDEIYETYKDDLRIYRETESIEIANMIERMYKIHENNLAKYIENEKNGDYNFNHKYKEFCEEYLKNPKKYEIETRKGGIFLPIWCYYYNIINDEFLEKYGLNIIYKKDYINEEDNQIYGTYYVFKLNEETKKILLNNAENIFSWCFPERLEDLCFIKDDYYWLFSVAHEDICEIYPDNEEEYNYLKSIGVEFWKDHYVEEKKYKIDF